ncbi:hypothetical protein FRC18_006814 [Serendipita sp. 400]|nr:hypothetical protein FRC18_006814 [Serendipita sp. 400]
MYTSMCATMAYWSLVGAIPVDFQSATSVPSDQDSNQSPAGKSIMGGAATALIVLGALFPLLLVLSYFLYTMMRRRHSKTGKRFLHELDFISKATDPNAGPLRSSEGRNAGVSNPHSFSKREVVSEPTSLVNADPSATSLSIPARALLQGSDRMPCRASLSGPYNPNIPTKRESGTSEVTLASVPPSASPRLPPGLIDDVEPRAGAGLRDQNQTL